VSEESIHNRCAGLDDGPDLMPVDQFADGGAAMADELSTPRPAARPGVSVSMCAPIADE
jgi:hypothetical protein